MNLFKKIYYKYYWFKVKIKQNKCKHDLTSIGNGLDRKIYYKGKYCHYHFIYRCDKCNYYEHRYLRSESNDKLV